MDPAALPPHDLIARWDEGWVAILEEDPHVVVANVGLPAGFAGPPAHVHAAHADCFHVVRGRLDVRLGPELAPRSLGPGAFVAAPIGVAHAFVVGEDGTTFVNLHAPAGGFGDYLRALRDAADDAGRRAIVEAYDMAPPPADGGLPADTPFALAGEVEALARRWAERL